MANICDILNTRNIRYARCIADAKKSANAVGTFAFSVGTFAFSVGIFAFSVEAQSLKALILLGFWHFKPS